MLRVALKSVLGNKLRFALTALAVVLGVAFVAGVFVLTDSISRSFNGLFAEINAGTAVYVNPVRNVDAEIGGGGSGAVGGPTLPQDLLPQIQAVDGVEAVEGGVAGLAIILGPDGERVGMPGPPALGFSWAQETGPLSIAEGDGRPPMAADEIVIDRGSFEVLVERSAPDDPFSLGDTVTVVLQNLGPREFKVVGVSTFGTTDSLLGATTTSFQLAAAQEFYDKVGQFDSIAVVSDGTRTDEALRDDILAAVGDGYEVVTGAEQNDADIADIQQGLGFITTLLLAFAWIALFVGAFIIVNTFSIIIAQRTREFSLLRAIGATGRQIRSVVLIEALVVGIAASVIGFFAGIGLAATLQRLMDAAGLSIPQSGVVVLPRTIIASFVVGVGVTMVAAIFPSRRAAQITAIEGLRDTGGSSQEITHRRTVGGLACVALGTALLMFGLLATPDNAIAYVGIGVALTFVGVSLLAPHAAGPVARVLGALPERLGVPGTLARRNAGRNVQRTASTASALMIGVALVALVAVVTASASKSVDTLFEQFGTDLSIQADSGFGPPLGIPTSFVDELRQLDELSTVAGFRASNMKIAGQDGTTFVASTDEKVAGDLIDFGFLDGAQLTDLGPGEVMVDDEIAQRDGLVVGDKLVADFASVAGAEFTIVGIFTNEELLSAGWLLTNEELDRVAGSLQDIFVGANAAEGVSIEEARTAVEAVADGYVDLKVQTQSELLADAEEQLDGILNIMTVLLLLAIIIALIGIINTLALSVFERTREIGLLRAVGMTRRQTRSMIRWEAVIVSVFGALLGLAVGTFFGWALVQSLKTFGITQVAVPTGRMVTYVILSGLAGVVAAILPARRAARLDVLAAITTE